MLSIQELRAGRLSSSQEKRTGRGGGGWGGGVKPGRGSSPLYVLTSEAQFIVPDWGDKVVYGMGLSYWSVRLHRLAVAGLYDNPMPLSTLSHSMGLRIWLKDNW
jgi:hypothetical protein